jgi:protein TonB
MLLALSLVSIAQDGPKTTTLKDLKNSKPPTAAEVMRGRIETAKANLVVKQYQAAIYDLENIRRETKDPTVHRVLNVLLMHAYLEQGEYKKAQTFLKELRKNPSKTEDYFAVAGQVISGARTQIARYESLGVSTSGKLLPKNAQDDLKNMREILELVISHSRDIGKQKEMAPIAAVVVEESSSARSNLARDDYDKKRWDDQVAEAREQIVSPRTKIINAVASPIKQDEVTLVAKNVDSDLVAADKKPETNTPNVVEAKEPALKPVVEKVSPAPAKIKDAVAKIEKPAAESLDQNKPVQAERKGGRPSDRSVRIISSAEKKPVDDVVVKKAPPKTKSVDKTDADNAKPESKDSNGEILLSDGSPLNLGSLIAFATKRVSPIYPRQARTLRMSGMVKVDVLVDEDGRVAKVEGISGPTLLKRAARDAVRKWKFTPFERDGQPVKAIGFVSFNFHL